MFRRKKYIFAVKKNHRGRNIALGILGVAAVVCVALFIIGLALYPLHRSVTVEAGSDGVAAEAFLKDSQPPEAISISWGEEGQPDWNVPGEYKLTIVYRGKEYKGTVRVEDTIAPAADAREVTWFSGDEGLPDPMEFVADVQDATAVMAQYAQEPDMTKLGSQDVAIILTDGGDNRTEISSRLIITDDQEAPKIYGEINRLTYLGTVIPLDDGIAVVDDRDDAPTLTIDDSAVDFNQKGVYPVTYTATDRAGNVTEVTGQVTVSYRRESAVDIDRLNTAIDELLAEIIADDMTDEEKCRAVYDWAKTNVAWSVGWTDKTAWTKEAYRAIRRKAGDGFTTSAFFHGCMIRLGFRDMMVAGSDQRTYWNLVNLGDGWYHVDCSGKTGAGQDIFLFNDEKLTGYSQAAGNGAYDFDAESYPASE